MPSFRSNIFRMLIKYYLAPKFHAQKTINAQRTALEKLTKWTRLPVNTSVDKVQIKELAAESVSADNVAEGNIILFLHGGGYCTCSAGTHRELAAHISGASRARVLLPDYRLAPENPFPAALDDALSVYRWLLTRGYSNENISIAGDSAGGGLSIAASVALRDQGDPAPSSIACISPWTDLALSGDSIKTHAGIDPMLKHATLQLMASNYIANNDPRTPLISPLYADLKGLPPLLCQVGSDEILWDDSRRIVAKAQNEGVDATLKIHDRMWHVWHLTARIMPEAQRAIEELGHFVRNHFTN
jgi:acetyl esterase/lipase